MSGGHIIVCLFGLVVCVVSADVHPNMHTTLNLFTGRFAVYRRWQFEPLAIGRSDTGGYKVWGVD